MLAGEVSPQCFKAVSWWNSEICKRDGAVKLDQFTASYSCDIRREPLRDAPLLQDQLGEWPAEVSDHCGQCIML